MDRRGRLAQALKLKMNWSAPRYLQFPRVQRLARRVVTPIIEREPPRGAGTIGAAMLVAASVGYGIAKGGHVDEIASEMQYLCDSAANGAGLRISSVAVSGETQLRRADILHLVGVTNSSSLLCLDAAAARGKMKTNPWIAEATVLKLYPGRLQIDIKERSAVALWQKDGVVSVIAADGTVLEPFDGSRFSTLPLVVGDGAERQAQDFLNLIARYPVVRNEVEAFVLVAQRRWNLHLKNGIDVRLPETDAEQALRTLVNLARDKKLLSRDIVAIDLRLPDRVTVRLSDAAAQARDAAIKDAEKAAKGKRKGGSA